MTNTAFTPDFRAAVFGASGGIGAALVKRLLDDPRAAQVYAGSRTPPSVSHDKLTALTADITDDVSLEAAAKTIGAPLDLVLKTASIEIARRNKHAAIIGLHPGTVDTALSKPFQRGVPDGKLFSSDQSAGYLLDVIGSIDASDSGHVFAWDGARVPD